MSEQGPVHVPRSNGFGMVGLLAVDGLLSDVQLPFAEVGWCFHGLAFCWFKVWIGLAFWWCQRNSLLWDNLAGFWYFMTGYRLTIREVL